MYVFIWSTIYCYLHSIANIHATPHRCSVCWDGDWTRTFHMLMNFHNSHAKSTHHDPLIACRRIMLYWPLSFTLTLHFSYMMIIIMLMIMIINFNDWHEQYFIAVIISFLCSKHVSKRWLINWTCWRWKMRWPVQLGWMIDLLSQLFSEVKQFSIAPVSKLWYAH